MRFDGMRIGLIGPLPPPAGGMANQTRQLAELLSAERATVVLVQTNAPYRPAAVAHVPIVRAACRLLAYLPALWRAAAHCDVFHVMANSGWSWHLLAAPAIWIARARGVPVVINYRGGEASDFLARSHAMVSWSMRRVAGLAVPSRFLEEVFSRHGMRAQVLPNVVDLARFSPAATRPPRPPHLVVARHLEPIYDNETALRAFAIVRQRFPDATLTIAGTGPDEPVLRALAAGLGLGTAVRFAGWLDRDAMAALYRGADASLNASRADNMPNSVLEAMASGVPVVSTNVGGIPFMIDDERTALLVPVGDPQAMATAALRLLDDRALWARLSAAGLDEVQRYTWSRVAPELAGVYRLAIEAGH
jgi:glycosyltransferase involved in cell wall biosynthesis